MSITALGQFLELPRKIMYEDAMYPAALAGADQLASMVFEAPATGNITDVLWQTGNAVTLVGTVRLSLQHLDANGYPDGGEHGAVDVVCNNDKAARTVFNTTMSEPLAVTKNDKLAFVMKVTSFTSGYMRPGFSVGVSWAPASVFPYCTSNTGTPAKYVTYPPLGAVKIGGVYYPIGPMMPVTSGNTIARSDTTPDEVGNAIVMPWGAQADGIWIKMYLCTDDFQLVLYNSSNEVIEAISVDKDELGSTSNGILLKRFATPRTLLPGGTYRVILKPTTTTANNVRTYYDSWYDGDVFGAVEYGTAIYATTRTDAGAWTNYNAASPGYRRYHIGLLLSGIDVPTPAEVAAAVWAYGDRTLTA